MLGIKKMIVLPFERWVRDGSCARRSGAYTLLAAFLALCSCSSEGDNGTEPPPPPPTPSIVSLSAIVLSPGDTLVIEGENFSATLSANRVAFNNPLANPLPFFATAESLAVVVPQWANSGPMRVTSNGVTSDPVSVEILRNIGDVWVVGVGANTELKLPDSGSEEYVLIVHSTSTAGTANYSYSVNPDTTSIYPSAPMGEPSPGTVTLPLEFEQSIRRQAIEFMQEHAGGVRPLDKPKASAAPASTVYFWVLRCTNCSTSNPNNYVRVTATLRYSGTNALIYADVTQPSSSFTQADYDAFGLQFDSQIFPTDTTYFGRPTDIDGDGRVAILFSPRVNDLTPNGTANQGFITGFFLVNDLAPNFFPQTSYGGEIFYAMVPDPNGEYGNAFSKPLVTSIIPGTLAHEFEHMISFGYRFVTIGRGTSFALTQVTWLEEGMAHIAEDLNGLTSSNNGRITLYLLDPGNVSLFGSDTLEQRGGIFLFLRYLGDQLGNGIFKPIVRSACIGRPCVENVTSVGFFTSVADYLATLYLDDRSLSTDPKYEYTSNVDLGTLLFAIQARDVASGGFIGDVRAAAGDFYEMTGIPSPATHFKVSGSSGASLRIVIVRTS